MRDKLIELITDLTNNEEPMVEGLELWADSIADYLLENGVIVPPCKVGDTVYVITEKHPCYACKWCGDWCHKDCTITDKTKLVVKEAKVFYFLFQEMHNKIQVEVGGTKHLQMHFLHFNVKDFGKTVFLTYEQAEKALAEVANGT